MRIFVNGSFDLLHTGHIALLNYAKSLGSYLLVAIDSDSRISKLKGKDRPVNPFYIRKCIMENLKPVDKVLSFDSDDELIKIIKEYSPDIMIKGSDWRGKEIIGAKYAKNIVFFDRSNDESTTKIITNYINRVNNESFSNWK